MSKVSLFDGTGILFKKNLKWLKAYFLSKLEPELEPVKKIPGAGAGHKQTGSTTLGIECKFRL